MVQLWVPHCRTKVISVEESTEEGRQGTGQAFDMKVEGIKDDNRQKKKCEPGSAGDLEKVV